MINEEVVLNLRLSPDSPEVHERLTFLDRFLEAVGENPPDELVGLSREVHQAYHKARPQMEQTLGAGPFLICFFCVFWRSSLKALQRFSKPRWRNQTKLHSQLWLKVCCDIFCFFCGKDLGT